MRNLKNIKESDLNISGLILDIVRRILESVKSKKRDKVWRHEKEDIKKIAYPVKPETSIQE